MKERDCRVSDCRDGECRYCKRVRAERRNHGLQLDAEERQRRLARAREREQHIMTRLAERGMLQEVAAEAEALVSIGLAQAVLDGERVPIAMQSEVGSNGYFR